ncbi:beta strand repeat-containing protein [Acidisoma cellulosilyticum]|nr:Ig-like domain-containing protein [Acidisoma cellulosilyticum]
MLTANAPTDYYSFSVGTLRAIALQLTGLSAGATLTLLDASGNQIEATSGGVNSYATILTNLAPGPYFAEVSGSAVNTTYQLLATTTPLITEALLTDSGASASDLITDAPTVTGAGNDNTVVHFAVDGVAITATAMSDATGNWTFTPTGLADGVHTIVATEADPIGDVGSASLTFTLDKTPPIVSEKLSNDTGASASDLVTANADLQGSGEANAIVHLAIDGVASSTTALANAAGAWSFTPAGLADGAHTIIASETDIAGNTGSTSLSFTLDTTPPVVTEALANDTGSSATDLITSNPSLTGKGDSNATVRFVIDGVASSTTATANASGVWTFAPTGLADGAHTIVASEADLAGNIGSTSLTFTLDTKVPVVTEKLTTDTGTSTTDHITSKSPITGTGDANAAVHFAVDGVASSTTVTAGTTGAWTFTPTGLADGAHTIVATETDAAGNVGSASLAFTLDTKAPTVTQKLAADTGSSATDLITSNAALTGTGDANAAVHFTIDGVASSATATANASGVWSFTPSGLADGTHTIIASETDAAGNVGSASLNFTLDTTPPVITEALASDTGSSTTDKITSQSSLTGTGQANAIVSFVIDGVASSTTATANASGVWTFAPTGLADGAHTIVASEADLAGNIGSTSLTFTLDTKVPVVTEKLTTDTGTSTTDHITSKSPITGTGDANAAVHFAVDGVASSTTVTAGTTGAWTFTPTGLADGAHTIVATETDAAGNVGSASLAFTLDTKAPTVTQKLAADTGSSATDLITSNAALTGTGDANAAVHFTIDGVASSATATANASGVWSFTPSGLADGTHTIIASETDAAGNVGSASLAFTLDSTAPATTIALANDTGSSPTDKLTSDPTVAGSGDPNAVVHFTVDGVTSSTTATANAAGTWSFLQTGLAAGQHTIAASETDAAGNTGAASLTFSLYNAPTLTADNATVPMGGSIAASGLFTASVANGDSITNYEFIDATTANSSGYFQLNDQSQISGSVLDIASNNLENLKFIGGSSVGEDDIWVRATDGVSYGNWTDVQVQTSGASTTPPTVLANNTSLAANTSASLGSLFSVIDPNNLPISEYQVIDLTNSSASGHIALGSAVQLANQTIDFAASVLPTASFVAGAAGSLDTLAVRAYDGGSWSSWTSFTVSSH